MNEETLIARFRIGVIGLGYVGLPLAVEFGKKYEVIGFDTNADRVSELNSGTDRTGELTIEELKSASRLRVTDDSTALSSCNIFIITVPTPLDQEKKPDLQFLLKASETVGLHLKEGSIVVYESTVYPGCTEEDCVPVLERTSRLVYNQDFFCGYSPERINPGDKVHRLTNIIKITSGSTPETAEIVDKLYKSIIEAGTYQAPSIKVAEAAKAIENAQRDVNISFMNELALIFDRMGIDTGEVLDAAATKWNFLRFRPGLVGGHCIGVDPHYLAYKAMELGYEPQVILSGRKVNEQIAHFIAEKMLRLLRAYKGKVEGCSVLILGFAFKENCPDTRNTKVIDMLPELSRAGVRVSIFDPVVDRQAVFQDYQIQLIDQIGSFYDAIVIAVSHSIFKEINFLKFIEKGTVIFDTKALLGKSDSHARL